MGENIEVGLWVFHTTFNSISVVSWRPVLLREETGESYESNRTTVSQVTAKFYQWKSSITFYQRKRPSAREKTIA